MRHSLLMVVGTDLAEPQLGNIWQAGSAKAKITLASEMDFHIFRKTRRSIFIAMLFLGALTLEGLKTPIKSTTVAYGIVAYVIRKRCIRTMLTKK